MGKQSSIIWEMRGRTFLDARVRLPALYASLPMTLVSSPNVTRSALVIVYTSFSLSKETRVMVRVTLPDCKKVNVSLVWAISQGNVVNRKILTVFRVGAELAGALAGHRGLRRLACFHQHHALLHGFAQRFVACYERALNRQ